MSEVTEFIAAIAAIAKDPKAWEKRLGDADAIAQKLTETRSLQKRADEAAKQAATDLETARYERGQADHAQRATAQQAAVNLKTAKELDDRESKLVARERAQEQLEATQRANYDRRDTEIAQRERAADSKLAEAQALMQSYDEAKHKAAIKLAS
jgi:hypothetical protein